MKREELRIRRSNSLRPHERTNRLYELSRKMQIEGQLRRSEITEKSRKKAEESAAYKDARRCLSRSSSRMSQGYNCKYAVSTESTCSPTTKSTDSYKSNDECSSSEYSALQACVIVSDEYYGPFVGSEGLTRPVLYDL